jgi:hypothetical protein
LFSFSFEKSRQFGQGWIAFLARAEISGKGIGMRFSNCDFSKSKRA